MKVERVDAKFGDIIQSIDHEVILNVDRFEFLVVHAEDSRFRRLIGVRAEMQTIETQKPSFNR